VVCSQEIKQPEMNYPSFKIQDQVDNYFGIDVQDPFRSLENVDNAVNEKWYKNQGRISRSVMEKITGRELLLDKFIEYGNRAEDNVSEVKVTESGYHFYLKRRKGENTAKLYFRLKYEADEILLFDPAEFDETKNDYVISYFNPSWNGEKVVVAITHSGHEISDLLTIDVTNRSLYPEKLSKAWPDSFLGVSWLPDNSGFVFLRFEEAKDGEEITYSVLHKLGEPELCLKKIFGENLQEGLLIEKSSAYPIVTIDSRDSEYAVGYMATVENFWDAYITPIEDLKNGNPIWKPFFKAEDKVYTSEGVFYDTSFYYRSNKHQENNTLNSVNLQDMDFSSATIIASASEEEILESFVITNSSIYYTTTKNGVEAKFYRIHGNEAESIALPFEAGSIFLAQGANYSSQIWLELSGWTSGNRRFYFDVNSKKFKEQPLSSQVEFAEFNNIRSKEILIQAYDGVDVPLSIIYRKGTQLNKSNSTLFYTYGAYGTSIPPFFSPIFLTWVELGGILCIPHVRGGGEKGEEWHLEGMMSKKENSWKDLIAATEYMIEMGYTSKSKTVIYSMSAGGIVIGGAIVERPDLFAAAIAEVPILNPLRSEFRNDGGSSNMEEYGTLKDSIEAMGLIKMDPYINLRNSIQYPAILATAGVNDPRVPLWMPGKFIAKAQGYSTSGRPILFLVNENSGHGAENESLKLYEEYVDVFSFAFWQTGDPKFQYYP
tara:strand:+ start:2356 stop:4500 length:2145 start_codon:yes stop_codon:yes gene_type:complete